MSERYPYLVSRCVDGTLESDERVELCAMLAGAPDRPNHFRKHLMMAELLEHQLDPTRSGQAFMEGLAVRLRAEEDGTTFVARVNDEVRRKRFPFGWALAAAAAVAVVTATWLMVDGLWSKESAAGGAVMARAEVVRVEKSGQCSVFPPEADQPVAGSVQGEKRTPAVGMLLAAGERVEVGKGASMTIGWRGEATRVEVRDLSRFTFHVSPAGGKSIQLEKGRLEATVAKQETGKPMMFSTPHADVTVLGTRLKLSAEKQETRVDVDDGKVSVASRVSDARDEVTSGQTLIVSAQTQRTAVLGEVLVDERFEQGMNNWIIRQGGGTQQVKPTSEEIKKNVYLSPAKAVGTALPSLVLDAAGKGEVVLNATYNRFLPCEDMSFETEFMVSEWGRGQVNVNLGLVVETRWSIGPLERKTLVNAPPKLPCNKWYTQRGEYKVFLDDLNRRVVVSSIVMHGREWYRHRSAYDSRSKTPLVFSLRARNATVRVRRVIVRRLVKQHGPPQD